MDRDRVKELKRMLRYAVGQRRICLQQGDAEGVEIMLRDERAIREMLVQLTGDRIWKGAE